MLKTALLVSALSSAADASPITTPGSTNDVVATNGKSSTVTSAGDEVKSLPGWSGPLPSKIYSGFLDATPHGEKPNSLHMHYIFVESERSPSEDPVLVWSNGGPGAASVRL